ncbi:MAG: single-stranded-DNA-specific exonuclease RecJ [Planctomycetes bacterium]|nr:single-stranded-DNA-specific exonuclease RecJ [Planctomycetota bacterium]
MPPPRVWSFRRTDPDLEREFEQRLNLSPLAARVLATRGIASSSAGRTFLDASLKDLSAPADLTGTAVAVERLTRAIAGRERILVFGDSDVDGLTGASLLARLLKALHADVDVHVSERTVDGYGLSEAGEAAVRRKAPAVLVTVDHGVTAHAAVGRLQQSGIDVIVTDHHQKPEQLPPGLAVLNPLFLDPAHPAAKLSGAGVAFKLACGLFETLTPQQKQDPRLRATLREGLAFAALGTVADVVSLTGENRLLVRHGLKQLAQTTVPGLAALRSFARLDGREIDAEDVSFGFAPRINAAGRMGQVDLARRLLLSDSQPEAAQLAAELDRLNQERRALEARVHQRAQVKLKEWPADAAMVVLSDREFHAGVIGIVAAKLVSQTGKPVVLIASDGTTARGSGRSVPGFDLAGALHLARDCMRSCGGHAMAAGLEMDPERADELAARLRDIARDTMQPPPPATLELDGEAMLHQITFPLVQELRQLGPFGQGHPQPLFAASGVELAAPPRRVGVEGGHLQLKLKNGPHVMAGIAFGQGARADEIAGRKVAVAFTPRPSTFAGNHGVELQIADVKPDPGPGGR